MRIHLTRKLNLGMTLAEVVMATGIIAVTGAGCISSINYGMFIMRMARENQRATQVMLERLESIRLYNWDQITNNSFIPDTFTESYDPSMPTNGQGLTYFGTMSVDSPVFSTATPSYAGNMRQITVTLQWTNAGQVRHSRSVTTYVARDGEQNYVY